MSGALDIEDLHVTFAAPGRPPVHAVRGVSFSVAPGEMFCIVGESGSGKTLTASAALRLLPPDARMRAARLVVAGTEIGSLNERQLGDIRGSRVGMVFQNPMAALNPSIPIGRQLAETYLRHRGGTRAAAMARATTMLERAGIAGADSRLGQYPHELSGGIAQRVMIALALICEPAFLIADEPTTALDVTTQAQVLDLLAELRNSFGMAVLMITHDLRVVSQIADRIAVMYAGQFVETGTREEVLGNPRHPYTSALIGAIPRRGRERLTAIPGLPPQPAIDDPLCGFRERCAQVAPICAERPVAGWPMTGHAARCLLAAAQQTMPEPET